VFWNVINEHEEYKRKLKEEIESGKKNMKLMTHKIKNNIVEALIDSEVKIKLSHIPNAFIVLDSCSLLNIYQFYKRFFQDVVIPFSKKSKMNFQFIVSYNVTQEMDNINGNR
jgi:hypothetical protein